MNNNIVMLGKHNLSPKEQKLVLCANTLVLIKLDIAKEQNKIRESVDRLAALQLQQEEIMDEQNKLLALTIAENKNLENWRKASEAIVKAAQDGQD